MVFAFLFLGNGHARVCPEFTEGWMVLEAVGTHLCPLLRPIKFHLRTSCQWGSQEQPWVGNTVLLLLGPTEPLDWLFERCFFPTKERSSMDTTTYWAQTYKFHTFTASDTRDFHWSKAACYLLRFSMLQSKTFPYYKIIFEPLDDPSSRPWVKWRTACRLASAAFFIH